MRKHILTLVLLVATLVVSPLAVWAEPARQELKLEITSPEMGAQVRGRVVIMGSASVPNFQFYKVEFGIGSNPGQWAVIGSLHDQPVINGQLEVWDTSALPDDVYTVRLTGVKQDGNWEEFYVRNVVIANSQPTPSPTPTETATPQQTNTPSPSGSSGSGESSGGAVIPVATPTLQIIAPTAALTLPTATPTLSRPNVGRDLPIDTSNWQQSFCSGGLAMGAVFVLLGLVFGIRRLL